jgi:hypothetical protein
MTQYAYPVSSGDETDGSWTDNAGATNLYVGIDDVQPLGSGSDSTYISSTDSSASSDICTIHLGETITDPGASASSHIVYFRVKGAAGFGSIPNLTVALVEGATNNTNGTVRATYAAFAPTSSFADGKASESGDARFLVLDATESGNISDYNDLQLRFTRAAGGGMSEQVFISQAYMAAPDAPGATEDFRVGDRVKETGTGTSGDISLAGAVTGYQTFVAGIGTLNMTYYVIEDANGTAWETGIGKVTDASPDTLTRSTVIANSSGTTSVITLSGGTHTIFCGSPSRTETGDAQIKTTTYTVTQADSTILCDTSGGAWTLSVPMANVNNLGLKFLIKKVTDDANILTISSGGTDFEDEDGAGLANSIKLHLQWDYYELMSARHSSAAGSYMWVVTGKHLRPHLASIRQTTFQTLADDTRTLVRFDITDIEVGADADYANDKITIKRAGTYNITGFVKMSSMDINNRALQVNIGVTPDGGSITYYASASSTNFINWKNNDQRPATISAVMLVLDVDDVVTLYALQDDGGSEPTGSGGDRERDAFLQVQEVR